MRNNYSKPDQSIFSTFNMEGRNNEFYQNFAFDSIENDAIRMEKKFLKISRQAECKTIKAGSSKKKNPKLSFLRSRFRK